jgi:phenylacetate-coenzyme A ligase PaaK-like adenylate-forming protein
MCGECTELAGLHVPEDLVHLDIYDPQMKAFVYDGNCGRAVLTTLLQEGTQAGTLLLNYDTEDTTTVLSRERCACGRTHMRIVNPQREAETVWIFGDSLNRVDVEAGVFQPDNMQYLSGEYEAFIYDGDAPGEVVMRLSVECVDPEKADRRHIEDRVVERLLRHRQSLADRYEDRTFAINFNIVTPGALELQKLKGRPKRLVDRRSG